MEALFLSFLVVRSSLDIFTDIGFYIGPMNLNVPSVVSILILISGGLYFVLKGRVGIHKITIAFGIWLLLLIPFVLLSIYNFGFEGLLGVREWVRLFTIFMIFLLSFNFTNRNNRVKFLNVLFLSLLIPLSVGFYQLITHSGSTAGGIYRIYGTLNNPNPFALYLIAFVGLTYWKLTTTKHKFWFFLLLLEIGCLIATFSLGGYVMFGILALFLLLKAKKGQKIIITFLIIGFVLTVISSPQFQVRWKRIKKINISKTIEEKEPVESITQRIIIWYHLLSLWKEKPLLGYGLQTASSINPFEKYEGIGYDPHNDFLKYLVETGLIGLLFYIIFIILVGSQIYQGYRFSTDLRFKSLLFILFAVFVAWQIGSLAENFIASTTFQYYFWAILGIALKSKRLQKKDEDNLKLKQDNLKI